ncbi:hypothetical protein [Capsulimonas corticalis]|uniref:hypothetical protein n=1 Tax=Capsulimonas corticalis TaxID=2219043 RepID=UPI000F64B25B|nr:hypothetical protein [Capsulimonas corticalis]
MSIFVGILGLLLVLSIPFVFIAYCVWFCGLNGKAKAGNVAAGRYLLFAWLIASTSTVAVFVDDLITHKYWLALAHLFMAFGFLNRLFSEWKRMKALSLSL